MIKGILQLLKSGDFLVNDEDIAIAKGKYEAPTILKELNIHVKRNIK